MSKPVIKKLTFSVQIIADWLGAVKKLCNKLNEKGRKNQLIFTKQKQCEKRRNLTMVFQIALNLENRTIKK